MKKFAVLIIIAILLLSGCSISHTVATGIIASKAEIIISESPQSTQVVTNETTEVLISSTLEASSEPTTESTPATQDTEHEATPSPAETTQKITGVTTSEAQNISPPDTIYSTTQKRDVLVLMLAYPGYITGVQTDNSKTYLIMKSGKSILYDDKRMKTVEEKITDADVQDMLETPYPLTEIHSLSSTNVDPGRTRAYDLINGIYGSSKDIISNKLTSVDFGDQHLPFNKEAGAAAALAAAAASAAALALDQPQIADFLYPSSGTFNYRVIAGTDRLSPHAYGIAIDLKSSPNGYWRWASPEAGEELLKSYPRDIVRIFENNGFIWGGKWNHFDLFHFEYRPEIIIKAKYFSGETDLAKPWYQGADLNSEAVDKLIGLIDQSLD